MMRYQRVSPDCLGLPNGRKPSIIRTTSSSSFCKDDDADTSAARISNYPPFDAKPLRVRSGSASGSTNPLSSTTQTQENHNSNSHHFPSSSDSLTPPENPKSQEINGTCSGGAGGGGDVLLQWGHNKRSRGSRAENRAVGDESSVHSRQHVKIQRRAAIAGAERIAVAAAASAMPPPCGGGYTRGANLRASMPLRDPAGSHHNRTVEDRSGGHSRSEKRSPPSPSEKANHHNQQHKTAAAAATNGFGSAPSSSMNQHHPESSKHASDQDTVGSGSAGGATAAAAPEKVSLEQFEWPRIYISLSRKEKEDDFLAMKGTKLPQRPKKRAKNIDKSLQYCFPGMWLSDLTRGRYEVREKKCVKKKRRGLKGMESMDSDSE